MCSPEDQAEAWLARAEQALDVRDLAAARLALAQAELEGANPGRCDGLRWTVAMLQGRFEEAWLRSDAIRARNQPDPHRFWLGQDLRGSRVIVRCLHGFGDAVQMLRYAPLLAQLAGSVVYEVPPQLLEVAPYFFGVDRVITWGEHAPAVPPVYDVQVEVMELPYLFRTQAAHLPLATAYLQLPAPLLAEVALRLGRSEKPRAGVVWSAGEWNPARSIPLACLKPVLEQSGYEFWNLQGGTARTALSSLPDATEVCGPGILALAATIAHLDLVITVDTLAAHLAGALGKPVFLLLQFAADWRWLTGRTDSPWYPGLSIFRQPAPDDWPAAIAQVCQALEQGDL